MTPWEDDASDIAYRWRAACGARRRRALFSPLDPPLSIASIVRRSVWIFEKVQRCNFSNPCVQLSASRAQPAFAAPGTPS